MKYRMAIDTPALAVLALLIVLMGGAYTLTLRTARLAKVVQEHEASKAEVESKPPPVAPPPPPQPTNNPPPECVRIGVMEFVKKQGPGVAEIGCEGKRWRCIVTVVNDQATYNCGLLAEQAPASGPQGNFSL